jgi:hypothetical protein
VRNLGIERGTIRLIRREYEVTPTPTTSPRRIAASSGLRDLQLLGDLGILLALRQQPVGLPGACG